MKYIISGTNRKDSRSFEVSLLVQKIYAAQGEMVEIIDLKDIGMNELDETHYAGVKPRRLTEVLAKIVASDGLIFVVPEYNGSMPGILKYFIDHWKYPEAFEFRPVAFVGLGGMFGALRAVEQLQMVLGYRNAFMYPERIFLTNIWNTLKNGELKDPVAMELLEKQVSGFRKFTAALQAAGLDANSIKRN